MNIFDANNGTNIGYWKDAVPHTTNISIPRMGSPNKIMVPREQNVTIIVVVENPIGSTSLWSYSMSSKKHK